MAGVYRTADSTAPAHGAVVITPSDVTVIPVTRSVYVGTTGNLAVRMGDGQTVTFTAVPVGVFPIQVDQVLSTGTTAATLLALLMFTGLSIGNSLVRTFGWLPPFPGNVIVTSPINLAAVSVVLPLPLVSSLWNGLLSGYVSTTWEVRTGANGTGTLVWSDTALSILNVVPSLTLSAGSTFYIRARHTGTLGQQTPWSPDIIITT